MSVRFRKYQNKIKSSKSFKKWFGRAVVLGNVSTDNLAEEISHATTVTRADIRAVLDELSLSLRRHLLNSQSVKLDGIGTFHVTIHSIGTATKEDFDATKIKSYSIVFTPERKMLNAGIDGLSGKAKKIYVNDLLDGINSVEMPKIKAEKDADAASGTETGK